MEGGHRCWAGIRHVREAWDHILGSVRGFWDLEPDLLGPVEQRSTSSPRVDDLSRRPAEPLGSRWRLICRFSSSFVAWTTASIQYESTIWGRWPQRPLLTSGCRPQCGFDKPRWIKSDRIVTRRLTDARTARTPTRRCVDKPTGSSGQSSQQRVRKQQVDAAWRQHHRQRHRAVKGSPRMLTPASGGQILQAVSTTSSGSSHSAPGTGHASRSWNPVGTSPGVSANTRTPLPRPARADLVRTR